MMLKDNLADTLKGFHFRNGNITEEQVRIFKRKYKEIARHNIRYKKIIGAEVKEDIEELKNLDYEELLREYAENKQDYLEAVRKQDRFLKGNVKKWKK